MRIHARLSPHGEQEVDDRAVRENVAMEQRAAFVKKCMAEMK
jgi:hypothetical protein